MVLDENAKDLLKIHKYCVEELQCDTHAFQFLKGSPIQHSDIMFDFDKIFEKAYLQFTKIENYNRSIKRSKKLQ